MPTKVHVDEWPDPNCHATTQISVCYKEGGRKMWLKLKRMAGFPYVRHLWDHSWNTVSSFGVSQCKKDIGQLQAVQQKAIKMITRDLQRSLPTYISLWFCEQAAVEEVEEREYRFFEPELLLKPLCCENTAPGSPEQGSVSLHTQ